MEDIFERIDRVLTNAGYTKTVSEQGIIYEYKEEEIFNAFQYHAGDEPA